MNTVTTMKRSVHRPQCLPVHEEKTVYMYMCNVHYNVYVYQTAGMHVITIASSCPVHRTCCSIIICTRYVCMYVYVYIIDMQLYMNGAPLPDFQGCVGCNVPDTMDLHVP